MMVFGIFMGLGLFCFLMAGCLICIGIRETDSEPFIPAIMLISLGAIIVTATLKEGNPTPQKTGFKDRVTIRK